MKVNKRKRTGLTTEDAVNCVLGSFPRFYYFFTPIAPFKLRVAPEWISRIARQLQIKESDPRARAIEIADPLDAILLLLETLDAERKKEDKILCSRRTLRLIVARWMPLSEQQFTKQLNKLYATKLITAKHTQVPRPEIELALTKKGRTVLEKIKAQRAHVLRALFTDRTEEQLRAVVNGLQELSSITWEEMLKARK